MVNERVIVIRRFGNRWERLLRIVRGVPRFRRDRGDRFNRHVSRGHTHRLASHEVGIRDLDSAFDDRS